MKNKAPHSKLCVFLALILFCNSVLAVTDALSSSDFKEIFFVSHDESSVLPCHDESSDQVVLHEISHSAKYSEMASDCCIDICQCDDSGCHTSSLVFQPLSQFIYIDDQDHLFNLAIYLSLSSTPSSPPPII